VTKADNNSSRHSIKYNDLWQIKNIPNLENKILNKSMGDDPDYLDNSNIDQIK
jgi:phage pi2 protein 07